MSPPLLFLSAGNEGLPNLYEKPTEKASPLPFSSHPFYLNNISLVLRDVRFEFLSVPPGAGVWGLLF